MKSNKLHPLVIGAILFLFVAPNVYAQNSFKIIFYNVENYFDSQKDSITADDEFTPEGKNRWTRKRFIQKRNSLYKALVGVSEGVMPDLIGLAEIENYYVLRQLTQETPLSYYKYSIVHHNSPDPRGIDVALLYRSDKFKLLSKRFYEISKTLKTREILYVKGLVGKDTLHVFVNHWPSKRGGTKKSDPKRKMAAEVLRNCVDSLFNLNSKANICLMGDFNDYADSAPITKGLKASSDFSNIQENQIYNLSFHLEEKGEGSIRFKNRWELIDLFFVSGNLLNPNNRLYTDRSKIKILKNDFLLESQADLGVRPKRTFLGPKYNGGISDHLPIQLIIDIHK